MDKVISCLIALIVVAAMVLAFNVILWALWNFAIAPLFGWPTATFWQVFFICAFVSFVARLIRGK